MLQEAVERGIARAKGGDYSQALECYKQALETFPKNADALVAAGAARANQEDLLGALQCFDDALGMKLGIALLIICFCAASMQPVSF